MPAVVEDPVAISRDARAETFEFVSNLCVALMPERCNGSMCDVGFDTTLFC